MKSLKLERLYIYICVCVCVCVRVCTMLSAMLHIGKCMQLFCLFLKLYPFLCFNCLWRPCTCKNFTFCYSQPLLNHQHDCFYSSTSASTPHCLTGGRESKLGSGGREERGREKLLSSLLSLLRNSGNVNSYRRLKYGSKFNTPTISIKHICIKWTITFLETETSQVSYVYVNLRTDKKTNLWPLTKQT
jgi:hypothetical protein